MTLLAWFAGIVTGVLATLVLLNLRPAPAAPRWVEPEDGLLALDPYLDVQAAVVARARLDPSYRAMLMEDADMAARQLALDPYLEQLA